MYGEGISKVGEIVDLGVNYGIIKKSGAWFSYGETRLGQGRDNVKNLFKNDKALSDEIEKQIREKMADEHGAGDERKETAKSTADDDAPIAYRPVKTTKTAARAKIDVAVDDDE